MTETRIVSIEEVRTLVAERQRYEDWLKALDAKRAETPVRVFERVHNDYVARRRDVMDRLLEHVGGLTTMANDFDVRLQSLDSKLGTLEDERAEAMLRTSVGEFDSDRWERVKHDVESQITQLGEQRHGLISEIDEVRTLLASARSEPEVVAPAPGSHHASAAAAPATLEVGDILSDVEAGAAAPASAAETRAGEELIDVIGTEDAFGVVTPFHASQPVDGTADEGASADELSELENALSLFGGASGATANAPTASGGSPSSLNELDVFDDAELGDLRMAPPARSTATATPPASPSSGAPAGGAAAPSRDGFDDLAFLRSVVDPSASAAAASSPSGDQQKSLRCTECGTMNFPTEWYCERCGGELAAF